MGKEALIVERETLFGGDEFQGFLPLEGRDFISLILKNHRYYPRGEELESDRSLQQIIPYIWIVNPEKKEVFLYKRKLNTKKDGEFKEQRYLGKYSGGVGGHIDKDTEEGTDNPIMQAMMRELQEETKIVNYPTPEIVGYINDDSNELGEVHFGLVAIAETKNEVRAQEEEGLKEGNFHTIEETEEIFNNSKNEIESWTKISWPFIKSYLKSL